MDDGAGLLTRHKLDVDDYHRMGAAGILTEEDRVELIDGELIEMAPIGQEHFGTVNRLTYALIQAFGDRAVVSPQNPLRLDRWSEPEPDFVVLKPRADFYASGAWPCPADVLLLIEVSVSSLRFDREVKLSLYARAGIPEVWIVDPQAGVLHTHRRPDGDAYREITTHRPGETIAPALAPDVPLAVARVFC